MKPRVEEYVSVDDTREAHFLHVLHVSFDDLISFISFLLSLHFEQDLLLVYMVCAKLHFTAKI